MMGASDSAALTGGGASDVPPPRASISIPPSTSSQPVPSSSSPPETLHQKVERIKAALELRTPANQIAACLREANAAMGFVNEDDLPKPQVAERLLRALGILHQKVKRIKDALDLRTPANQIAACLREANAAMGFVNKDYLPKPQVAELLLGALFNCASAEAESASEALKAPSAPPAAVALTFAELAAATDGFGEQRLIGSGGYGRVFTADTLPSLPPEALPLRLRHKPFAVKHAKSGVHDLAALQREVRVLQQCNHPYLLPLLGFCLEHGAPPCLVFPLMRGGSLADRLWPKEADPERLRRLGLGASLSPLTWHQRLRILRQATDALLYLHTPVPGGKGAVVHRDFKPENILLDDELNAYLADTGFAKMDAGPEASKMKSASNAFYLTLGYLDPSVSAGGAYSAVTDGWALGITLLVALTGRSPLKIINKCEEEFELDFAEIDAEKLADAGADWPPLVATTIKDVVQSAVSGLCHDKERKRLTVSAALATLTSLVDEDGSRGSGQGALDGSVLSSSEQPASSAAGYVPSPLSMQVRETRKGTDAHKSVKDNMLLAFSNLMPRLDAIYAARAAKAPEGFEERINYWHRECGMRADLKDRLHSLRIWRNAASHLDDDRWRRDGPRGEVEASQLVSAVKTAIEALEGASSR